jgi:plasmid maintenance system antidote protein VapI
MKSFKDLYKQSYDSPIFLSEQLKLHFLAEVKRKMDEQGVTKSALAKRINSSPAYISKLFGGPTNMSAETMAKLANALDTKVHIHLASKDASVRWFDLWQKSTPAPTTHKHEWSAEFFANVKERTMNVEDFALAA